MAVFSMRYGTLVYSPDKGVFRDRTKNGKSREFGIDPDIIRLLKVLKEKQKLTEESEYVFTNEQTGKPLHPDSPRRYLKKLGEKCGIKGIHPHMLRHSFASIAITSGADIASVSEKLGHSDKAVTLRMYTELNALRSFAFDARREYFPESNLRSLSELTEGKKIIVIGGHINWRNDLKNKYPAFQIFDGNVNTADLSSIQSADFVFLNVSNMSHAMYYKVMSILRANNIPEVQPFADSYPGLGLTGSGRGQRLL